MTNTTVLSDVFHTQHEFNAVHVYNEIYQVGQNPNCADVLLHQPENHVPLSFSFLPKLNDPFHLIDYDLKTIFTIIILHDFNWQVLH